MRPSPVGKATSQQHAQGGSERNHDDARRRVERQPKAQWSDETPLGILLSLPATRVR